MARPPVSMERIEDAVMARYAPVLAGGVPLPWERVAAVMGVCQQALWRWRQKPEWVAAVAKLDDPELDHDGVVRAKNRLLGLIDHKNPNIAMRAARSYLEFTIGRRLAIDSKSEVTSVATFDLSGLSGEELRELVGAVAKAEGVGPGRRSALPVARVTGVETVEGVYRVEGESLENEEVVLSEDEDGEGVVEVDWSVEGLEYGGSGGGCGPSLEYEVYEDA